MKRDDYILFFVWAVSIVFAFSLIIYFNLWWITLTIGALVIGVFGYIDPLLTLKPSRKRSSILLGCFICVFLGQLLYSYITEKESQKEYRSYVVNTLSQHTAFNTRFIIHPDGQIYPFGGFARYIRAFNSSYGYKTFLDATMMAGGASGAYSIPSHRFDSEQQRAIEYAAMSVLLWLHTPLITPISRNNMDKISQAYENITNHLETLKAAYPDSTLVAYCASRAESPLDIHYPRMVKHKYVENISVSGNIEDSTAVILVKGEWYLITIDILYNGRGALNQQECEDMGLPLHYNAIELDELHSYDFQIVANVKYTTSDVLSLEPDQLCFPTDLLKLLRIDFDWNTLADNLSFTATK